MTKDEVKKMIEDLSQVSMKLSLKAVEKIEKGNIEKEELKQLNDIKKHLSFAKRTYKELYGDDGNKNKNQSENYLSESVIDKIKNIEKSVGELVRTMPTH